MSAPEVISFGGLEGATGEHCLPPCRPRSMLSFLRSFRPHAIPRILKAGLDPLVIKEAGWGIVWPEGVADAVRDALEPLLRRRRRQAGPLYHELEYYRGDSLFDFLERYGVGPDSVDPQKVPFYLLIVGGPEHLPFDIQVELAISRAVGRITFETVEGYSDYVEQLVLYEEKAVPLASPNLALFGVENQDDPLTHLAVEKFIRPLERMVARRCRGWILDSVAGSEADKEGLRQLLTGDRPPSVMLTASHAVRFRPDSPRQATHQGALVCADWPGPKRWQGRGAMIDDHLFTAADLPANTDLSGLMALLFACYSAGTPHLDAYAETDPRPLAAVPFVSPLPRALLRRGALAVIGHVDLAFEHSFLWYEAGPQLEVFDSILYEIRAGLPVGFAMRHLSQRHAQLAVHVAGAIRRASQQEDADLIRAFHLWAAYVDARNYILLGDPAARLKIEDAKWGPR